ncbi:DNA polymerase-3 subunit epsilon [Ruegeria halocynthiae]|uniref:DNA polymerase-3 subunit epsilon n=1 Tax=Ruegeria halocynthiae TaxID=985054 RepID=A0A1H2RDR9_9RHOB|nr:exonuclease domain-containing protein [Ruegeria halocynthiae]SDW17521.1 DNA polymerase-3 subunit epsilon [Ruegeria halocynthiae]
MKFFNRLFGTAKAKPNEVHKRFNKNSARPEPADPSLEDVLRGTYRFVALDVETANSDASSICQIGFAVSDGQGTILTFGTLVDPETHFDPFNIGIHGIDEDAVYAAPVFPEVLQTFRVFLERHPLVQHSSFDKRAVNAACDRYDIPHLRSNWHDSVVMARRAWPELKGNGGHGLANLKEVLGLEFEHHDAIEDAKAAAHVVLLAEEATGKGFEDLTSKQSRGPVASERSRSVEGNQNGPLYGHVACFTGKLSMSRSEASTVAAGAGISVKASVSKKITLLIVGDQDLELLNGQEKSSKHRRAEELIEQGQDIKIIGESDFRSLVGEIS